MSLARLAAEAILRDEEDRAALARAELVLAPAPADELLHRDRSVPYREAAALVQRWWETRRKSPVTSCEIETLVRSLRRLEE